MSLHEDDAMHTTTADDAEFAALMAASSLGAPHVRAFGAAIPDEARRALHAAATCPETVSDSGADKPWTTCRDNTESSGKEASPEAAGPVRGGAAPTGTAGRGHASAPHPGRRLFYAEDGSSRCAALVLALDALRLHADLRAVQFPCEQQYEGWGRAVLGETTALWWMTSGPAIDRQTPVHRGAKRLGRSTMGRRPTTGHLPVPVGPVLLGSGCSLPVVAFASGQGFSAAWTWLAAGHATTALSSMLTDAGTSPSHAEVSRNGRLSAVSLTDLLLLTPLPWYGTCSPLIESESWTGAGDVWEVDAARPVSARFICRCESVRRDSLIHRRAGQVMYEAPRNGLPPAHVLVAAQPAVDLGLAALRIIPAQPPRPPDLDAYEVRPTSTLLLPALPGAHRTRTGEALPAADGAAGSVSHTAAHPLRASAYPRMDSGLLEWSDGGSDGRERHARVCLRFHRTEDDEGQRLTARLVCRADDPYAITVVFLVGPGEETAWVFARELLADGLHRSVGIGDVIVWPGPGVAASRGRAGRRIFLRLRSPEGTALLSMDREDAQAFLDAGEPPTGKPVTLAAEDSLSRWQDELTGLIGPRSGE